MSWRGLKHFILKLYVLLQSDEGYNDYFIERILDEAIAFLPLGPTTEHQGQ